MNTARDIVAEIEAHLGLQGVRLSLTDHGSQIAGRLGGRWFASVVDSQRLAHPGRALELILTAITSEPFMRSHPVQPGTAGGMYGEGRAVGRLTVPGTGGSGGEPVARILTVPSVSLLDDAGEFEFIAPTSRERRIAAKIYKTAYSRAPLLLDRWRQSRNSSLVGHRREIKAISPGLVAQGPELARDPQQRPAVWLALHWLETGGAESWAFDAARIARDAGFEVIITADVPAPQRELDKALELADHVYVPANVLAEEDWGPFLRGVVSKHRIAALHIHHSGRAYGFLPELRHLCDDVLVIDSTHIVEHRTGGFVRTSVEYSNHIDQHHVISPELRDIYLLDAGLPKDKVHYHPLTRARTVATSPRAARAEGPLRIGFLGRLAPQKRPFLFVELVARLHAKNPEAFSFVMQGSGVLSSLTAGQIAKKGLGDVIERRDWGPVGQFMDEVDVLVISSDNEGLTLTTLEAEEHGVLVLSADVGSQRTVIAPNLLVPRDPSGFLGESVRALTRLATTDGAFAEALAAQAELVASLESVQPARDYLATTFTTLKESL